MEYFLRIKRMTDGMDESQKHVEPKKPDIILYNSIYIDF